MVIAFGTDLDYVGHLLGRFGKNHGIGHLVRNPRRRVPVLFAHRWAGLEPIPELLFQHAHSGLDATFVARQVNRFCHSLLVSQRDAFAARVCATLQAIAYFNCMQA